MPSHDEESRREVDDKREALPAMPVEVVDECGGKFVVDLEMTPGEYDAWIARVPAGSIPRDRIYNGTHEAIIVFDRAAGTWAASLRMVDEMRGVPPNLADHGPWHPSWRRTAEGRRPSVAGDGEPPESAK